MAAKPYQSATMFALREFGDCPYPGDWRIPSSPDGRTSNRDQQWFCRRSAVVRGILAGGRATDRPGRFIDPSCGERKGMLVVRLHVPPAIWMDHTLAIGYIRGGIGHLLCSPP